MVKKSVKKTTTKKPAARKSTTSKMKERYIVDKTGKVYGTIKIK